MINNPKIFRPQALMNSSSFFCVLLYIDYFSDLPKYFQVLTLCNTNVEYRNKNFCYALFMNFFGEGKHTHSENLSENVLFGFRKPQNTQFHQNLHFENLTNKYFILYHT